VRIGLTAIAAAAKAIVVDGVEVAVAGGHDNHLGRPEALSRMGRRGARSERHRLVEHAYMPMLQTAENVVRKYQISREAQDAYALSSQQRTARSTGEGTLRLPRSFPSQRRWPVTDKATNEVSYKEVTLVERTKATGRRRPRSRWPRSRP
jgi:acetyl-CoA acetyltransferase